MSNLSIHEGRYGRFDESLHWARRAFALSGKRANDYYHVAFPLLALRDDALTRRWLREGERRSPDFGRLQMMLAFLEVFEGRIADAQQRVEHPAARRSRAGRAAAPPSRAGATSSCTRRASRPHPSLLDGLLDMAGEADTDVFESG